MEPLYDEPFVMFELGIAGLTLDLISGTAIDVTETLSNGRASYILFENLVARFTGLSKGSQGGLSDLLDAQGLGYEVKSYRDPDHPRPGSDYFHTAASSTFGPNNHGPRIKRLLLEGSYQEALDICLASGYNKNGFYVYTNTGDYNPRIPFRYFIVPTEYVLDNLSPEDPRLVSRAALLSLCRETVQIS